MKNNKDDRNRNQDQWRNRDRDWQNRNQGNTDYDERNRNWNDRDRNYEENRFSGAGNFNNTFGGGLYGGSYGQDWDDDRRRDDDYNRQGRNSMNRNVGNNDFNRQSGSWYGNSEYGRGYENQNFNRGNYRDDNDRNWWDKTTDEVSSWFGDEEAERRRRMDKLNGPHRGKGPKGYTRSDEKIRDDVNDKLYHDPFVDASNIEVTVSEGEVTLTGTVDSKETKRRAEDLAEEIIGVKDVSNNLKVVKNSSSTLGNTSFSGTSQNEPTRSGSRDISESYRRN